FFFSSRRRHTRSTRDWSSDVCSSDLSFTYAERLFIALGAARKHRPDVLRRCRVKPADRIQRFVALEKIAIGAEQAGMEIDALVKIGRASCREREDMDESGWIMNKIVK